LSVKTTAQSAAIFVTAITASNAFRSIGATGASYSGNNLTGFTIYMYRTNTTATGVWWMVIGE
jgi:hypothetical protein